MKLIYAIEVGRLGTNQNDIEAEFFYFYNQNDALSFAQELRQEPFPPYLVKQRVYTMYMNSEEVQEALETARDFC